MSYNITFPGCDKKNRFHFTACRYVRHALRSAGNFTGVKLICIVRRKNQAFTIRLWNFDATKSCPNLLQSLIRHFRV